MFRVLYSFNVLSFQTRRQWRCSANNHARTANAKNLETRKYRWTQRSISSSRKVVFGFWICWKGTNFSILSVQFHMSITCFSMGQDSGWYYKYNLPLPTAIKRFCVFLPVICVSVVLQNMLEVLEEMPNGVSPESARWGWLAGFSCVKTVKLSTNLLRLYNSRK